MILNLNQYVYVKLTDYGKNILLKEHERLVEDYSRISLEFELPEEDYAGWSKWQVWKLIETFGKYLSRDQSKNIPFEFDIWIPER